MPRSKLDGLVQVMRVFLVRGFGAMSMFLLYAVVARRLPIDEAGYFFVGLASVTMLVPIAACGLQIMSLRLISARSLDDDRAEIEYVARKTLLLSFGSSLVLATAFYALAPWLADHVFRKPELGGVLRWFSPAIVLGCMAAVRAHHLQGIRQFTQSLTVLSIATPLAATLGLLWFSKPDSVDAAQAYLAASFLCLLLAGLFWRVACPRSESQPIELSGLARSCFALWTVNTMVVVVNWSGQVIAAVYADAADVAVLSVAQRTANLVNFILIGVNFVVTPRFARHWANRDHARLRELALKSTGYMSCAALPLAAGIAIFPRQIMSSFGAEFGDGAMLLVILSLAQLVNVISGSVNALLSMCGFESDLRNILLTSGAFAILLSVVLTRTYGVQGTAIATAVALVVQNIYAVWMVKKRLGFSMFSALSELRGTARQIG